MELVIAFIVFSAVATAGGHRVLTRHLEAYGEVPDPVDRAYRLVLAMIREDPEGGELLEGPVWHQALAWCFGWQESKARLADARARRRHVDQRVPEWEVDEGRLVAATVRVPMDTDTAPGSRFRKRFGPRWRHAFPESAWELDWRADNAVEATALEPLPERVELSDLEASDVWYRVPIGLGQDGPVVWDLTRHPHMLASGRTGMGKSVALRTLVRHLADHGARVVGLDPKRVDLSWIRAFEGCEHVKPSRDQALATRPIADKLGEIVEEMDARYDLLEQGGYSSIADLEDPPEPLVVVVEELGELADDKTAPDRPYRKRAWTHLSSIASLGRAAGIHLVCATQHPYSELLSGGLRDNMAARIAVGWLPSNLSPVAVDGPEATELLDLEDPPGRAVARLDGHEVVQVAWTDPIDTPPAPDPTPEHDGGCSDDMALITNRRENPQGSPGGENNQEDAVPGYAVRAAREAAELTQAQLAAAAGVSQAYISMVERGAKPPSRRLLEAAAEVCDAPELLDGSES